jgi:hypothetical protein
MPYEPVLPEIAIAALRAFGATVTEGPDGEVSIKKGEYEETLIFPHEGLRRHLLFRLQFHCGVPIRVFFHPELIPGYAPRKPN